MQNNVNGWTKIKVDFETVNEFYQKGNIEIQGDFYPNEYVLLANELNNKQTALGRYEKGKIVRIKESEIHGIKARNLEQRFLCDALVNDKIKLVSVLGAPGTGKSLLIFAHGFHQTLVEKKYKKIIIIRPLVAVERNKQVGYLKGDKNEKLLSGYYGAIYDIAEKIGIDSATLETYIDRRKVEIEATEFIRGRNFENCFVIVDEVQNMTAEEIFAIASRVEDDCKLCLAGDIGQIDDKNLNKNNNALSIMVNELIPYEETCHVMLTEVLRSRIAEIITEIRTKYVDR